MHISVIVFPYWWPFACVEQHIDLHIIQDLESVCHDNNAVNVTKHACGCMEWGIPCLILPMLHLWIISGGIKLDIGPIPQLTLNEHINASSRVLFYSIKHLFYPHGFYLPHTFTVLINLLSGHLLPNWQKVLLHLLWFTACKHIGKFWQQSISPVNEPLPSESGPMTCVDECRVIPQVGMKLSLFLQCRSMKVVVEVHKLIVRHKFKRGVFQGYSG